MRSAIEVEVKKPVHHENDHIAALLRDRFAEQSTLVLDLISSPGSGKTSLIEATVKALGRDYHIGALTGGIATERDADRLRALGIPASQILTGGGCHLDAQLVNSALSKGGYEGLDLLFIENVGGLICPATHDLGEDFKVALLSVTEGDDKPFKYPGIFARAALTVITKADLLPYVSFDLDAVRAEVASLNPSGRVIVTSAMAGDGIWQWCQTLSDRLSAKVSVASWIV
jgi:hydrogenase nickel incorporation protein HypB